MTTPRRGWAFFAASLLPICALAAAPRSARADAGELAAGLWGDAAWPLAACGGVGVRLGLADAWAGDLRLGAGLDADGGVGRAGLGLTWLVDFLSWVPELRVAAGGRLASTLSVELELSAGVRFYVSREWSLALALGGRWSLGEGAALLRLELWRALGRALD